MSRPCYLVEWYRPELTIGQIDRTVGEIANCNTAGVTPPVQLLMTLEVPTDEVIFGVFAARSAEDVREACQRAGCPAERLSVTSLAISHLDWTSSRS